MYKINEPKNKSWEKSAYDGDNNDDSSMGQ